MTFRLSDPYKIAWILWIALFVLIEGIALFNKRKEDTLSENLRIVFATEQKPRWPYRFVKLRRLVLVAGLAWFTIHILTPGWL